MLQLKQRTIMPGNGVMELRSEGHIARGLALLIESCMELMTLYTSNIISK